MWVKKPEGVNIIVTNQEKVEIVINPYQSVRLEVFHEFPKFRIEGKEDSRFMKVLSWLLFFNKGFMEHYHTTIGNTLYVASSWDKMSDEAKASLLLHERVHLRQQKRYSMVLYILMYLVLLPTVWTFRAKLEKEAYEETIRARLKYKGTAALNEEFKAFIVSQFTTSSYFWMDPFKSRVEAWYDSVVDKVLKEQEL